MSDTGFGQFTYRGFTVMPDYEGENGEVTGYTIAVEDEAASEVAGEEIGSMEGGFDTPDAARTFIDAYYPEKRDPTKHTRVEDWHAEGKSIKENIGHGQVRTIARFDTRGLFNPGYDEGNAAYVVLCVQAHEPMIRALRDAEYELEMWAQSADKPDEDTGRVLDTVRKALVRAAGGR